MLFNSLEFPIFFILVYILYRLLSHKNQNILLLIASYIFYGWWDQRFLFLIIFSTGLDYSCALMIDKGKMSSQERYLPVAFVNFSFFFFVIVDWQKILDKSGFFLSSSLVTWLLLTGLLIASFIWLKLYKKIENLPQESKRKLFLCTSMIVNLGLLATFKYFNFFIDSAEYALVKLFEQDANYFRLNLILPVGISFYTFQIMSYTIDVYRKDLKATNRFFDFCLFVSYFPQLVAGPIERATELLPAILNYRQINYFQSMEGLRLILWGFFKKIAIADSLVISVNSVFESQGTPSWLDVVIATVLFAFQIYGDFSGYTDIARGTSKLLGIELMLNFNMPYFSKDPSEFWQRWHISLSTWLRDYLYIPLGGNRRGNTYSNLMTTMVLGGLWHGAAWNFILWGGYQGFLLCFYRFLKIPQTIKSLMSNYHLLGKSLITILFTTVFFVLTCYGWFLFRANSLSQIIAFSSILVTDFGNLSLHLQKPALAGLLGLPILIIYDFLAYYLKPQLIDFNRNSYADFLKGGLYGCLVLLIIMGMSNGSSQFIYFQF